MAVLFLFGQPPKSQKAGAKMSAKVLLDESQKSKIINKYSIEAMVLKALVAIIFAVFLSIRFLLVMIPLFFIVIIFFPVIDGMVLGVLKKRGIVLDKKTRFKLWQPWIALILISLCALIVCLFISYNLFSMWVFLFFVFFLSVLVDILIIFIMSRYMSREN